jgi:hypothetical protein
LLAVASLSGNFGDWNQEARKTGKDHNRYSLDLEACLHDAR